MIQLVKFATTAMLAVSMIFPLGALLSVHHRGAIRRHFSSTEATTSAWFSRNEDTGGFGRPLASSLGARYYNAQ